jgi:hypothetical protein
MGTVFRVGGPQQKSTPFRVFSVTAEIVSLTTFFSGVCYDKFDDLQLHHWCRRMTPDFEVRKLISWHDNIQWCYEVDVYVSQFVYKLTKVYTNETCH